MNFITTKLQEVMIIEPKVFGDERGFFMETYQAQQFSKAGIPFHFVQDNHSGSSQGVLRGLHYQLRHPQGKLLRAIVGEIFDVVVDIRKSSPTFGKWVGIHLSALNRRQVWAPPGFAHGFFVISNWAEVLYKTTDFYAPEWERTILWNDPTINIQWPVIPGKSPVLSEKDQRGQSLLEAEVFE
ncbi:MAG: dTDP-4-dehydrorhamnose 3,5-epimerase [Anaerolineales bacterium]|nr:dTDP-4-dehydrorhamnose 3,5-epimerase [Anaerolineales bacterium]